MEVLNVIYRAKPGKGKEYYQRLCADGIDTATREEPGNLAYSFYRSMEDPDEILLLEIWTNEETRAKHKTTAHFKRLTELYQLYVEHYTVNDYKKEI